MPPSLYLYQKILLTKFLFEFGGFSDFGKTISSKNRKVSLLNMYIFVLIKIYGRGMA